MTERPSTDIDSVIELLVRNEAVASSSFSMIPSEAPLSPLARTPYMLDAASRYFFPFDGDAMPFRSAEVAASVEDHFTIPVLRELSGARHVNPRPISGLNAMMVALSALAGPPGSSVVSMDPVIGGHYATTSVVERLGLRSHTFGGWSPHTLDEAELSRVLRTVRPSVLYVDQANRLFPLSIARRVVEIVREESPDTLVHVDVSHLLGLVLGGVLPNPLACGATSFGGSTHKTFPGPQKGVLFTDDDDVAGAFAASQFFLISNHHFGSVLSLTIAALEFRDCGGAEYARRVPRPRGDFAEHLALLGATPEAEELGYTACHQVWLRTAALGVPGELASNRLADAGFRVNVLPDLPMIDEPALRMGLHEMTYLGVTDDQLDELATYFGAAIFADDPARFASDVARIRAVVRSPYQFASARASELLERLSVASDFA